jgi:hypothetical protein
MQSDSFSLDAQTAHIQTFVQSQGCNLIQLYTDAGVQLQNAVTGPPLNKSCETPGKAHSMVS